MFTSFSGSLGGFVWVINWGRFFGARNGSEHLASNGAVQIFTAVWGRAAQKFTAAFRCHSAGARRDDAEVFRAGLRREAGLQGGISRFRLRLRCEVGLRGGAFRVWSLCTGLRGGIFGFVSCTARGRRQHGAMVMRHVYATAEDSPTSSSRVVIQPAFAQAGKFFHCHVGISVSSWGLLGAPRCD